MSVVELQNSVIHFRRPGVPIFRRSGGSIAPAVFEHLTGSMECAAKIASRVCCQFLQRQWTFGVCLPVDILTLKQSCSIS